MLKRLVRLVRMRDKILLRRAKQTRYIIIITIIIIIVEIVITIIIEMAARRNMCPQPIEESHFDWLAK